MASSPLKVPSALARAEQAYTDLEVELDDAIRTMEKWPQVRDVVLSWAASLTTTNCSWGTYGLGAAITQRWQQRERQRMTQR